MTTDTFAGRLARLVAEARMSPSDLASTLGVSENQARRVMDGTTQSLKLDAALRLCKRLGISPWELGGEREPPGGPPDDDPGETTRYPSAEAMLDALFGPNLTLLPGGRGRTAEDAPDRPAPTIPLDLSPDAPLVKALRSRFASAEDVAGLRDDLAATNEELARAQERIAHLQAVLPARAPKPRRQAPP